MWQIGVFIFLELDLSEEGRAVLGLEVSEQPSREGREEPCPGFATP